MGWLIALGVVLLIALLPVGVSLIYQEDGLVVCLLFGAIKWKLYPKPKKEPKKAPEKTGEKPADKKPEKSKKTPKKGGKLTDFMPLLEIAIDFLGSLRRKLRVKHLQLLLTMAGDDPCDLAVNYGKAWAAAGNLLPQLERIFVIKKRDVQVQCDFLADATRIKARLDVTITIGRAIGLLTKYGIKALIAYLKIMKTKKGGASK